MFGSELGIKPLFFRPPYSIDKEPDTNDQAAPAYLIQQMGYTIIGNKIDTNDWDERAAEDAAKHSAGRARSIATHEDEAAIPRQHHPAARWRRQSRGDGGRPAGADRHVAGARLQDRAGIGPDGQHASGSDAGVDPKERWQARVDSVAFFAFAFFSHFVVMVFFLGDVLMSARLILVGIFALIDRLRETHDPEVAGGFLPRVAVLIPAYNEEKVIVRTIRSVLNSDYPNLRIIVIDDGSPDRTFEVARAAYPEEIASGMLTVLHKSNAGKAEALNLPSTTSKKQFYVGIDADTVIAADAVSKLVVPLRRSQGRRGCGQCQGRQSGEPVDALAGARVHHQSEFRAARAEPLQCGHRGSRAPLAPGGRSL